MTGAGVHQLAGVRGRAPRRTRWCTGRRAAASANRSSAVSAAAGLGSSSSSARQALRSWPITVAAARPWPTQSPTISADPAVVEVDDVVPVAADLQRAAGRVVAHREPAGQPRAEHGVLQRQRRLPLLVELVHPLQALAEAAGQHRQQGVVLRRERPLLGQFDAARRARHAGAAGRCRPRRVRRCRRPAARRRAARRSPAGCARADPPTARARRQHTTCGGVGVRGVRPAGKSDGEHAAGLPHPAQLLGRRPHRLVEGVRLASARSARPARSGAARRSARR